jgi:hypothetical protein
MKKSVILTALIAMGLGFAAVPALAAPPLVIEIGSNPLAVGKAIYYDANHDGTETQDELIGSYDVYNMETGVLFRWTPMSDATSYRVSMVQYLMPGKGPAGPSQEIKIGHHFITNPMPNQYLMIGWGVDEPVCVDCVSVIRVTPETVSVVQNPDGTYEYQYLPMPGLIESSPFVLESWGAARTKGKNGIFCGDLVCHSKERNEGGLFYCPYDCP